MAGETVENLDQYRSGSKKYEVSLTFSGQAGADMGELMGTLNAATANEVVLRAIGLLLTAQGKEILLKDRNGQVESVEV